MRHLATALLSLGLALTPLLGTGCSPAEATSIPAAQSAVVGQMAPGFSLPDLDGNRINLSDYAGKVVVLEWFNPGCPFVVYAHGQQGPLADQAARVTGENDKIVWLAINSGAPGRQGHGVEQNQNAAREWNMNHPVLVDESGEVGRMYGARTTPHMYVIDPDGVLVYRGALDDRPMGRGGNGGTNYVDQVLAAIEDGSISPRETDSYGCSVKYAN